jgi:type I restriction enzyme S subunit
MAGEWVDSSLGDLIDVKHGFAFQGEFINDQSRGDILLTPGNFAIGGGFKGDRFKFFDGPVPENYVLAEGDLLVTMTDLSKQSDTLGLPAFVPARSDNRRYLHNQRLGKVLVKDRRAIDTRYLHYLLCSASYRHEILASATGTTVKHTSPERIQRFTFSRPPLSEQRAIAHILGALDDKIDLNRRMNKTLEAIARALFKSWFVDFNPVHSKAEGQDPGLPQHLADLFPDSFADSKLGDIPRGWTLGAITDFASLNPESWSKETRPAEINYIDLSNTKWGSIGEVTRYAASVAPSRAQRVLRPGDTIVGTVRPGNGSYALISDDDLTGSTGFAVLRPVAADYVEFVFLAATAADNINKLQHLADGGAYPAVRPEIVAATSVVHPCDKVLSYFSSAVGPVLTKMAGNEQETRTLAALRDTLLPNLISGEVKVAEAARLVGAED